MIMTLMRVRATDPRQPFNITPRFIAADLALTTLTAVYFLSFAWPRTATVAQFIDSFATLSMLAHENMRFIAATIVMLPMVAIPIAILERRQYINNTEGTINEDIWAHICLTILFCMLIISQVWPFTITAFKKYVSVFETFIIYMPLYCLMASFWKYQIKTQREAFHSNESASTAATPVPVRA